MSARNLILLLALGVVAAFAPIPARAENESSSTEIVPAEVSLADTKVDTKFDTKVDGPVDDGVEYLRPELEGATTRLSEGPRQFLKRASFSPGYGRLGEQEYFVFRFAYNPNSWLGWEAGLGHNPARSVQSVLHNLSAVLRYPVPFRIQPYASVGYGMLTIYPGKTINADPVTKNALTYGAGLEVYLRDDVAVRGEILGTAVMGRDAVGTGSATYTYREITLGFSFYRSLGQ